jgi:hypothetical protein
MGGGGEKGKTWSGEREKEREGERGGETEKEKEEKTKIPHLTSSARMPFMLLS